MSVKYSIVVPCFNEQESVKPFYAEIIPVMESLKAPYEIIFVNDGSRDKTEELLTEIASGDKRIKLLNLARNFGKQPALLAGLTLAKGEAVITIDADLVDPLETIPLMIDKWKMGFEIVHGKYLPKKGISFKQKHKIKKFTKFFEKTTGIRLPKNCTDFKLFDRCVVDAIVSMPEKNRFLCGMTEWVGFTHTYVEYERSPKFYSTVKSKTKKFVEDGVSDIISNSVYPLSFSFKFGIAFMSVSLVCFLTFIALSCAKIYLPLVAWLFPTVVFVSSIGFILTGFQNLYISRIFFEVQKRPLYIVRDKINFVSDDALSSSKAPSTVKSKKKNSAQK